MNAYLFIFGNTPSLSKEELRSVLNRLHVKYFLEEIDTSTVIKTEQKLHLEKLQEVLGGTVKIGTVVKRLKNFSFPSFTEAVLPFFSKDKKQAFGISIYGNAGFSSLNLSKKLKDELVKGGIKSRFVVPRADSILSSVVVAKQRLHEFLIIKSGKEWVIGKTNTVQDFSSWSRRDFNRPHADPKSGMLPPKVARMMVNIAIGNRDSFQITLLDPFCGMGTVLSEGLLLRCSTYGIDISKSVVEKAKANLLWIDREMDLNDLQKSRIICADATHASTFFDKGSIDCIVTEPYLGPVFERGVTGSFLIKKSKVTPKKLSNIIKGLEKLYTGSLKDWKSILKPEGVVVMVLPVFRVCFERNERKEIFVKKVIDSCEKLGYTLIAGPFEYARQQAMVKRNIYVLKKTK